MDARLLLIDAQEDFCNPDWGTLYVPGAEKDCERVAAMINRLGKKLTRIVASLDQHHEGSIFHPSFLTNSNGEHPNPFTLISVQDIEDGVWRASHPAEQKRLLHYVKSLENGGRYLLCIWPYHCLIGTKGSNIVPVVREALGEWTLKYNKHVDYVAKGSNYRTEHFSIVKAEVQDPEDPSTGINFGLIQCLEEADIIAIAGEAKSHCVANTVRDIMDNFGDPKYISKMHILMDATSSVPGFEKEGDDFIQEFKDRGGKESTTIDFLA